MARTPFFSPDSNIVVCSDGYFEVYPPTPRTNGDKPKYRGAIAELGAGMRGPDDRLGVRPDSAALADAVAAWSATTARPRSAARSAADATAPITARRRRSGRSLRDRSPSVRASLTACGRRASRGVDRPRGGSSRRP